MKRNLLLIVVYSATHYPILTLIYWNNYYFQTGKTKEKPVHALITCMVLYLHLDTTLKFAKSFEKDLLFELNVGVPCTVSRYI